MKGSENKAAIVTGGENGISKCISEEFSKDIVMCVIGKEKGDH